MQTYDPKTGTFTAETTELERQVHDLAECVLVANDKLELALLDIHKALKQINGSLQDIAVAIRNRR